MSRRFTIALASVCFALLLSGCASRLPPLRPTTAPTTHPSAARADGLEDQRIVASLGVVTRVPAGWTQIRDFADDKSRHQTWVSPSGRTAFGIIFFRMPLPVGHDLAFRYGFLREMRKDQGEATVLERSWDDSRDALRFVVEGGEYKVRAVFYIRGMRGWTVYAGSVRDEPEEPAEIKLAEVAREQTKVNSFE